ncbi:tRNA-intron lyase [Candidatus Pacearchaeota archaeon]|nr:tRNA-intron lyase [Candidatus Pacearchaeota archaeon]
MIQAKFSGTKIYSTSEEAFSLCEKSSFGENKNNKIEYALVEALFLVQEGKMQIFSGKKQINEELLIKKLKKIDKKTETKLSVFSDLRKKGYIIKTALKFGAEFRVYDKGTRPGNAHAKWILYTAKEHDSINWHEFAAKNRIAHSTNKNLLIAIVDEESDVSYYEVSWQKP